MSIFGQESFFTFAPSQASPANSLLTADLLISKSNPGVVLQGTETNARQCEVREVGGVLYIVNNATYNGTNWVCVNTAAEADGWRIDASGNWQKIYSAATAGAITWTVLATIDVSGNVTASGTLSATNVTASGTLSATNVTASGALSATNASLSGTLGVANATVSSVTGSGTQIATTYLALSGTQGTFEIHTDNATVPTLSTTKSFMRYTSDGDLFLTAGTGRGVYLNWDNGGSGGSVFIGGYQMLNFGGAAPASPGRINLIDTGHVTILAAPSQSPGATQPFSLQRGDPDDVYDSFVVKGGNGARILLSPDYQNFTNALTVLTGGSTYFDFLVDSSATIARFFRNGTRSGDAQLLLSAFSTGANSPAQTTSLQLQAVTAGTSTGGGTQYSWLFQAQTNSNLAINGPSGGQIIYNGVQLIPRVIYLRGSGTGNYTTTSTTPVPVDSTNLQTTVTIPVGAMAIVQAAGFGGSGSATVNGTVYIVDGTTVLQNDSIGGSSNNTNTFALLAVITGDGASHTISLQYCINSSGTSFTIYNSGSGQWPTMVVQIMPATN